MPIVEYISTNRCLLGVSTLNKSEFYFQKDQSCDPDLLTVTEPRVMDRRASGAPGPGGDGSSHAPALSQAHRRMSRMELPMMGARRMSYFRRGSVAASLRTDQSGVPAAPIKMQNTYRTEPNDADKFNATKVTKTVTSIMESFLSGEEYEHHKCSKLAQSLTDVIKARVREMHFPRYKIVCDVILGQNTDQGVHCTSRCVWNTSTDNYACATYKNNSIFAIAMVYGTYFE